MYIEKSIKYRKILVGCEFVTIIKILQFNCYWLMDSNIFLIKSGGIGLMIFNDQDHLQCILFYFSYL